MSSLHPPAFPHRIFVVEDGRVFFTIGVQTFQLHVEPDEEDPRRAERFADWLRRALDNHPPVAGGVVMAIAEALKDEAIAAQVDEAVEQVKREQEAALAAARRVLACTESTDDARTLASWVVEVIEPSSR